MKLHLLPRVSTRLRASVAVLLATALFLANSSVAHCAVPAYRPADDAVVVLRVADPSTESALIALRRAVKAAPRNPETLARYVNALVDLGRTSGYERYFGYAEQAIQAAPPDVQAALKLEQARLMQQRHDFLGAESLLSEILRRDPRHGEARLMRAQIRLHLNTPEQAMRDCVALTPQVDLLTSTTCFAQARAALGHSVRDIARAYELLLAAQKTANAQAATRSWSTGVAAELAARLGRADEAAKWYRLAFELDAQSHFPRIAYADWLLSQEQNATALAVARSGSSNADKLRAAIAECDPSSLAAKQLQLYWQEATAHGERNHLRDQARFTLAVLRDVRRAHSLASDNFRDHREVEDALVLIATARAVGDQNAVAIVQAWSVERNHIDARIGVQGGST